MVERRRLGVTKNSAPASCRRAPFRGPARCPPRARFCREPVRDFLQRVEGPRHGHGDLGGPHAARVNGFNGLDGALGAGGAYDRDDPHFSDKGKNLF